MSKNKETQFPYNSGSNVNMMHRCDLAAVLIARWRDKDSFLSGDKKTACSHTLNKSGFRQEAGHTKITC